MIFIIFYNQIYGLKQIIITNMYMRTALLFLSALFLTTASVNAAKTINTEYSVPDYPLIELDNNYVTLRGPIDRHSASDVIKKLHEVDSEEVFLYISSPGGSVVDGYRIVQTIDSLYKKGVTVKAVADVAISMAYVIFQSCPVRYARPSSILMQHQMSFGTSGPIDHVKNYVEFTKGMESQLLDRQSQRLGLTREVFKEKTKSDWWAYGYDITNQNMADEMVHVLCSREDVEEILYETRNTPFGPVKIGFRKCPLLTEPVSIVFENDNVPDDVEEKYMMLFDSAKMVSNYYEIKDNIQT